MENEYKIFPERFNQVLDLIELVDKSLAQNYKKVIDSLPDYVHEEFNKSSGEFALFSREYDTEFTIDDDILELEHFQFKQYMQKAIKIYPYFEDELDDDFDQLFLFSLTLSNVKTTPELKINYKYENGEYKYVNTEMNGVEIFYSVMLEKQEDDYCLTCTKELNGHQLYVKKKLMTYEELLEYAAEDDGCLDEYDDCDGLDDGLFDVD